MVADTPAPVAGPVPARPDPRPGGGFDPARVLASPSGLSALAQVVDDLRAAGYANQALVGSPAEELSRFALGLPVRPSEVGAGRAAPLVDAGVARLDEDDRLHSHLALFVDPTGTTDAVVAVPDDDPTSVERIYFGRDTLWLVDLARRFGPGRGALADLGTGPGAVAALLGSSYERVVATDLVPRTVASAALTLALNPRPGGRPAGLALVADVAAGLRPGSFDLVTANPPWVPDLGTDPEAQGRFSRGGTTGFELPRRFLVEAAGLLAPGGVAVVLGLDVTWRDGSRPLLALVRGLARLGYEVAIESTEEDRVWPDFEAGMLDRFGAMAAVTHVAVLIGRP